MNRQSLCTMKQSVLGRLKVKRLNESSVYREAFVESKQYSWFYNDRPESLSELF